MAVRRALLGVRTAVRLAGAAVVLALPVAAGAVTGHAIADSWPQRSDAVVTSGAMVGRDPSAPPAADGDYAFLLTGDDGSPVRWDPCRPISVVVRPDGGPPGGTELVAAALTDLAAATGLEIVLEGTTTEAPAVDRPSHQPDRYGDRWAPVLVAWADEADHPPLRGDRVGVATPVAVDPAGPSPGRYVAGSVVLEASWFGSAVRTTEGRADAVGVLKHELGHLVGLDHVDDPGQLMSPVYRSVPDWATGDRAGLALAGAGPCLEFHGP